MGISNPPPKDYLILPFFPVFTFIPFAYFFLRREYSNTLAKYVNKEIFKKANTGHSGKK